MKITLWRPIVFHIHGAGFRLIHRPDFQSNTNDVFLAEIYPTQDGKDTSGRLRRKPWQCYSYIERYSLFNECAPAYLPTFHNTSDQAKEYIEKLCSEHDIKITTDILLNML